MMDLIYNIIVGNDETSNHTLVNFRNGSYACSCGVYSMSIELPNLRDES